MNSGKIFEEEIKNSLPSGIWYHRIKDPAASFSGGASTTRFSLKNEFDMLIYKYPDLVALELKSNASTSISFSVEKGKSAEIKWSQIEALTYAEKFNIKAGLLLNYRKSNTTYYVPINKFNEFIQKTTKHSINEKDCVEIGATIVEQKLKKVRYKYNLNFLFGSEEG